MLTRRKNRWVRPLGLLIGGGFLLQAAGCAVDPDLLLQTAIQFFTEFAIFATENSVVGLR
jgi:hypothetical protein